MTVAALVDSLARSRTGAGSMNASTMTFVLFFQDPKISAWVRERTHLLANKHPSRVLIFDGTADADRSHTEPSTAHGEWVELGVHASSPHELTTALAQLALPDAPVVLAWISADIADDQRFASLAAMATTVIVSSSLTRTDGGALTDLVRFIDGYPQIPVQDLSYLRLAAWQETVAEFFDEAEFLPDLLSLREVQVTAGSEPEMYYMLGWLASRLAWTPSGKDSFATSAGETIRFAMIPDGPPRRLTRVELKSATTTFTAEIHPGDDATICMYTTGAMRRDERCAPLHTVDIASLVERAILTSGRDEVFIESLTMAKHILERRST
jgi:glucose-6-phosphate dehydrogenase assembly protein OpcA